MEQWREIEHFPGYEVSSKGRVMNQNTGRILAMTRNQRGLYQVGLSKDLKQYKRGVTHLVADAFVPRVDSPYRNMWFDTPIHLDGDPSNNDVENLQWRPRWFALEYARQFHEPRVGFIVPIREKKTGEIFPTSWEAATKYGLLNKDIYIATYNNTYVFPTWQEFELLD